MYIDMGISIFTPKTTSSLYYNHKHTQECKTINPISIAHKEHTTTYKDSVS